MIDEIINRNKNINRGFRKLDIWNLAITLSRIIHTELSNDKKIVIKIKGQIEDSSFSVHSNIAEGYCRRSIKETLRFYEIGLSSLGECYSQLFALFSSGQVTREFFDNCDSKIFEMENKMIKMNKELIGLFNSGKEWRMDYQ